MAQKGVIVILKVSPVEGKKNTEGRRGQLQTIGRGKKGNTAGVEVWGTHSGKERSTGEWRGG